MKVQGKARDIPLFCPCDLLEDKAIRNLVARVHVSHLGK